MDCPYGFAIAAFDSSFLSRKPTSVPVSPFGYPTQVRFGPVKIRARVVNDGPVKQAEQRLSFYDLLGVSESGTLPQIKQAYKQLARKYHPDVSPPDRVEEYTERFIRVHEAYETLSDPRRRSLYDRDLAEGIPFTFSGRRRCRYDEQAMEEKGEWKSRWQVQISELRRRSSRKDSTSDMSWASRMRRQRQHVSQDSS
ncbi:PREDICTED: chaperone protein dnaJ 20, chloroplastic-like isoform X2 [Tarenaya hassleriana]|uniref:chaperone protein dnaJ 20, chloroplastic-like isoform X1 n=1 Tax=Tarenaya hassleriana TaxID=28532 RepID=UPI00053C67FD|nr:PREDICTED: chaperone protein dnaJ 20, chloroplastic-like isoform X1 [Tarenaya hassleriana]XP_010551664.1 PREDICTED: chaperone protein dnaJ 20, chloroplastic-like isoform X2 [Tarenaya hassleriana]